jgi:tetratricopeptide (TPR) repeat protein
VWAAAVPHWFDGEILARTLGIPEEDAAARYARLQEMPFVQPVAGRGHAVHELTRRLLLDDLWRDRREAFRVWSRRAAEAFESRPDDPDFLLESIYHWLVADPDQGADLVWDWGAEWNNTFQYARLHALVQAGLEHEEAGRLEGRARGWVLFRKGQLHILYNEYRAAKTALEGALESAGGDRQLEAHCIKALGDVHLRLGEYGAARGRYEEALGIYREIGDRLGEANCIKALGDVHLRLGEYGAARGRYEEALGIYREISDRLGEANCIQALGDLWADQEEVEKALAFLDDAEARFSALGLPAYVAWVHNSRGNLWHRREDYAAAVEAYTRAIQAWPQEGAFYRNRADTFIEMGDFAAAAADLEQAATLAPEHPYLALRRAQLAFYMRDYSSALRHAQEALARRSPFATAALLAALAHLALGDEGEATRALEMALWGPHNKDDLEDAFRGLDRLPETVPPEAVERFRAQLREALNRFRPR